MDITRRSFAGLLTAAAVSSVGSAAEEWVPLFNGRDMEGWRPSENKASWKVVDGMLAADGPRSHLFYEGPVKAANFRNFELEVDALAHHDCNSGVYFHTAYQEKDYPNKGFEIQINNTAGGEGTYRERKKTGSLYGLRNIYKQLIADDTWFKINVLVRGKNVQIRLNSMLVVDYTEPTPPIIPAGGETERFLSQGTFALQCHNNGSRALFRSVLVRPLGDNVTAGEPPVVDALFRKVIDIGRHNVPMVDYHVHLKPGLTIEQALARSRRDGIEYGIAINAGKLNADEAATRKFVESLQEKPVFFGMQAEGREWTQMFSRSTVAMFDYVFTDAETWTDNRGNRMRLWIPAETPKITDENEFMELLVQRTVGILQNEPIDIYANPTFLPPQLAKDYDRHWTDERMAKVIRAAAENQVAIELNDRYKLPSVKFVRMAKEAKCKFSFGSNNSSAADLRRCDYGIQMFEECKLVWQDMFLPGAFWPRAVERKGDRLKA